MGASLLNGDPGSPSDDEDVAPPSSRRALSPTGSEGSLYTDRPDEGAAEPYEVHILRELPPDSGHTHRQISLNDYLDGVEAPKDPEERPHVVSSPKLRSSFPTDTRLNAMLHIDSDEDEDGHVSQGLTNGLLSQLEHREQRSKKEGSSSTTNSLTSGTEANQEGATGAVASSQSSSASSPATRVRIFCGFSDVTIRTYKMC